ncbi:MAG: galactokinase [Flavobacteriaceae bacterium]|nr:galactokinase [Flavobacteriaceae bacterium]
MPQFKNFIPQLTIESPGRINFIGEHTDYNGGFGLPTAIDKKIIFKLKKNNSKNICNIYSANYDASFSLDLENIKISDKEWENYILGVLYEIQQLTNKVEGFDCVLSSDIPVGSGISSSAALECGLAFGLNEMFDLGLSKLDIVKLSQRAEHNYVGTKCGIMDQYASVMSKKDHVILLDCQSIQHQYIPIEIKPYKILLLNTNVSHSLASSEYNTRREECEKGVSIIKKKYPEVNSLRDVDEAMLLEFKNLLSKTVYIRCRYVIEEKTRVLSAVEALKENRLNDFGALMYATHYGLSKEYEVSCPELDFLVEFSKNFDTIIGSRMMGGGFGGCTINLIHEDAISDFIEKVSLAYFNKFNIKLDAFVANPSRGTSVVN